jgi:regulator of protease activity HflC (stomatin/prohibitin superfamily)
MAGSAVFLTVKIFSARKRGAGKSNKRQYFIAGGAFLIGLLLFVFIPFGLKTVETGEIAVVQVFGKSVRTESAGIHMTNVISTKYLIYDLKNQQIDTEIDAYSKDAQSMTASLTLQFKIKAENVIDINRQYGSLEVLSNRIRAISEERTKVVLSSDSAMDLIAKRSSLSMNVENLIREATEKYFIDVTLVAVTDITFSTAFEQTVEQKMIAEQQIAKAEYEKQQAVIKAQQDLEVAKLKAEQDIAKAKGEADAAIETAKGAAKALKLKSVEAARMLGFTIVEITGENGAAADYEIDMTGKSAEEVALIGEYLKYIAYLETWDGKLPEVVSDGDLGIILPR